MIKSEPKFFMLYVDGQQSPTKKHLDADAARVEAERLVKNTGKKVYIPKTVKQSTIQF